MGETKSVGGVIDWILENWKYIVIIVGLFAFIWRISKKINKFTDTVGDIKTKIDTELPSIKTSLDTHNTELTEMKEDIKDLKAYQERDGKRNYYIVKGVLSSLRGLQEIGVNGPTTETTEEIEKFMMEQVTH